MKPVLSVHNISKQFGGIRAVNNVSFDVLPGEILGLIGPNGSGKSTLFNCILGQLRPTEGHCAIKGRATDGVRPADLSLMGVGRTFQQLSVFPKMSVLDNVILAGQEHEGTMFSRLFSKGDAGLTSKAEQLIDFFRLTPYRNTEAGSLSYGQQKLVDAAMAFMAGPDIVLLDEPAGGVNLTMLGYLKDRLTTYNREHGTTFVVIEHNMEFVMSLCTRIIVLAQGEVIAEGTPDQIRSNQMVIDAYLGG
ncbi:ABC transporter ATP-binding protein [Rhizobium halophilum]|uniref:ABC transporter ATP-binding protein n=1 Tax=Rhizobium halophilum TaxID=2846852 RepID=UPI001EFE82B6|nr:ABC transporter ATP-binding protein [Rhizobium halophilum]MCF6370839.1 ABC transporter ATP-binding protein [Rhizobium halophilum]